MFKFRFVFVLVVGLALAGVSYGAPHALASLGKVASAPIVHPKRTLKQAVGSVVFVAESVNDVVFAGLTGLDKGAAVELKHNPFHYVAVADGKIDKGLERAETYFFNLEQ